MDDTFRIDELAERAALAVAASGAEPPSARVSALPDRRMLRYYTTLGLLDPPVEVRGRTAYYGRRHLLQVVAVKRLQAEGLSLAEVQRRLAGASTAELEKLAGLPAGWNGAGAGAARSAVSAAAAPAPAPAAAPRRAFWRDAPAEPSAPAAIRLAPGVTLVLDAARPLSPRDHEAVRAAAAGLVAHLSTLLEER